MPKKILLENQEIEYKVKRSCRARRMRLSIYCDGNFVVTVPQNFEESLIEKFIREKAKWVVSKLEHFSKFKNASFFKYGKREYLKYKSQAFELAKSRADYFSGIYDLQYKKINIKNQKTRWGSCSRKGNLNFNYKIALLPPRLADYIIVHELCHLKEFNHSKNFWNLVAKTFPDYSDLAKRLRNGL